ncbi:MAG: sigma-70 family RNA polymerase sigma factor [Planctomycetota bacterium]
MNEAVRSTVEDFQNGDRAAFAQLVSQFQNLVTSTALAETGDFQRSEDIAQQTFLVAWQKQSELRDPSSFGGWLRGIARNLARNDRRLKSNANRRPIEAVSEPATDVNPTTATSQQEQNELLWSTLDRIPVEYREPMILFYREEQSVRNVATLLNLSEAAVKQRLRRGREMLREEIRTMVEDLLYETRPSHAFSASVMAAIPMTGVVGSNAAKVGTAFGFKAVLTKMFGVATTGAFLGILGGLVGVLGGIGGAWAGMQSGIKNATSEEEKSLHRGYFRQLTTLSIVYFLVLLPAALMDIGWLVGGATIVYCVILVGATVNFTRQMRRLHAIHGKPAYLADFEPKPVSRTAVILNTILSCAGVGVWLVVFAFVEKSPGIGWLAIAAIVAHCVSIVYRLPEDIHVNRKVNLQFNARTVMESTLVQAAIMLVAVAVGANVGRTELAGLPFWVFIPVVILAGILFNWVMALMTEDVEESS